MSAIDQLQHEPSYHRRSIGFTPITNRSVYGYIIQCSCGWTETTNESKAKAKKIFSRHKTEAQASEATGAAAMER